LAVATLRRKFIVLLSDSPQVLHKIFLAQMLGTGALIIDTVQNALLQFYTGTGVAFHSESHLRTEHKN